MQPEAGVVGPLLAIAFILDTAIFRSLSERSGQVPASTLTNSVANDPKRTNGGSDGPGWYNYISNTYPLILIIALSDLGDLIY